MFLDVGDAVTKRWRFAVLLSLATVIATAGVLSDSTATVIGAMIVAPVGTPIIGTALGIVTGNVNRVASSAITVVLGATAVVVIGWALAAFLPELIPLSNIVFTAYGYAAEAQETTGFRRRLAYSVVAAATVLIAVPMTITTIDTVEVQSVLSQTTEVADQWATGTNTVVVKASFDGDDLVLVLEDPDNLPAGDLLADLQGVVPPGTNVVVNHVSGERYLLGTVA